MLSLSGTLFCICAFDTWKWNFLYLWTILISKIYHMLVLSGTSSCCISVFDTWEYHFWYPWFFQKYNKMLGLSGTLWYAVFVCLYFGICAFDTWEYHFWYPWTNLFSKIYHMLCLSGTLLYAVFVYLFICFCAFYTCIIFDSPEKSSFQKYTTCLGFLALVHVLYLCNCVFVYLYLCILNKTISW